MSIWWSLWEPFYNMNCIPGLIDQKRFHPDEQMLRSRDVWSEAKNSIGRKNNNNQSKTPSTKYDTCGTLWLCSIANMHVVLKSDLFPIRPLPSPSTNPPHIPTGLMMLEMMMLMYGFIAVSSACLARRMNPSTRHTSLAVPWLPIALYRPWREWERDKESEWMTISLLLQQTHH